MDIICLTPVYNDWASLDILIKELKNSSENAAWNLAEVIVVNDCSRENLEFHPITNTTPVSVLNLSLNVGHQRAIAIGLSYINDNLKHYDGIVVIDSDGEDNPNDIKQMIDKSCASAYPKIIFAHRLKRSEEKTFIFFYLVYKFIFTLLTNQKISFGNFSFIPRSLLKKVVSLPDLWNHYSGSIIRSRLGYDKVPTIRGKRYHGKSTMNFNSLVLHGLSSISIYLDVVTVKLLIIGIIGFILTIITLITVIIIKLFTNYSTPGWASNISLTLINIMGVITIILLLLLFHLNQRNRLYKSPANLYKEFIINVETNSIGHVNNN